MKQASLVGNSVRVCHDETLDNLQMFVSDDPPVRKLEVPHKRQVSIGLIL